MRFAPPAPNPNVADVVCSKTGQGIGAEALGAPVGLCRCCPAPGSPMLVRYSPRAATEAPRGRGLFRHGALLPVTGVPDDFARDVGSTETVRHRALGEATDAEVWLKNEGTNPTGSFKDRGLAVAAALAWSQGARRLCLPTQGNAGVAAAFFSRRAGLEPCLVYMPEGYEGSVYHLAAAHFGAEVRFSGANIAACGPAMRAVVRGELESGSLIDVSTFYEPGRLEGKKTLGLEIFEAFGGARLPDTIIYPTGGGTGLVGIHKAFEELCELGQLSDETRLPRLVAVQSEQCAPVVRAFEAGLERVDPVESKGTIADGLDVPGAIMGHGILRAIRATGGSAVAVSEAAILDAFGAFGRYGIAAGYESAATLAALYDLRKRNIIARGERVLLLLTGRAQTRARDERSEARGRVGM